MNILEIRAGIAMLRPSAPVATLFDAIGPDVAGRVGIADAPLEKYLNGNLSTWYTDEIGIYAPELTGDGLLFLLNSVLWWATKGELSLLFAMVDRCFPQDVASSEYETLHRICREESVSSLVHDIARYHLYELGTNRYHGPQLQQKITDCVELVVAAKDILRYESIGPP